MALRRRWLPVLWGIGLGAGIASYLWGSSPSTGLIIGDKILFTLVIPMAVLLLCVAVSMATAGRNRKGEGRHPD